MLVRFSQKEGNRELVFWLHSSPGPPGPPISPGYPSVAQLLHIVLGVPAWLFTSPDFGIWVRVKIKPSGDRRFWSIFPFTRLPFGGYPIFDPQYGGVWANYPTEADARRYGDGVTFWLGLGPYALETPRWTPQFPNASLFFGGSQHGLLGQLKVRALLLVG